MKNKINEPPYSSHQQMRVAPHPSRAACAAALVCYLLLAVASMWLSAAGVEYFAQTIFALASLVTGAVLFAFFVALTIASWVNLSSSIRPETMLDLEYILKVGELRDMPNTNEMTQGSSTGTAPSSARESQPGLVQYGVVLNLPGSISSTANYRWRVRDNAEEFGENEVRAGRAMRFRVFKEPS